MGTTDLQATLRCSCGREIAARSRDAGGFITCSCGNSVAVPKLSQLRLLVGADAYVTNPAEAIRKAQRDGKEPAGYECLGCGAWDPVLYECSALCEQSHVKKSRGEDHSTGLLRWFFLPFILNIMLSFRNDSATIDRQGHDIDVTFRLPLCKLCAQSRGNPTRPAVAKQLMMEVPLLANLVNYYPQLTLKIVRLNP
jgi:hypothetical protein